MTDMLWIRSHVERLLQDEWDVCRVTEDEDGDYPFRSGTAGCWVRVIDGDLPMVRVFAYAAVDVKPSMALLRELNDIQTRCLSASLYMLDNAVLVSQTISPIGLTQPVLAQAMNAVAGIAHDTGSLVAAVFGGSTPYPADEVESEDAA